MSEDLKYPIGKVADQSFTGNEPYSEALKNAAIQDISLLPPLLENAVLNLDEAQLDTLYRPEGWTVKQLVHHVADSHMNAYTRFKLALTEDKPTIKAYEEKLWAELADVQKVPVNISITLLHALHSRLYAAIKDLSPEQWNRTLNYPGKPAPVTIWFLLGMYSWHGKHHTAHILAFRSAHNL